MGGLLKYAIVLTLGVAIGAYIVSEPPRLEDIAPIRTERQAAVEHAPSATPESRASINEEVAKRLALETAKAEQLLFAGKTPAPGNPEAPSSPPSDARPAGEPALPSSPWPQDAVPATAATTDASQDAKPMNEAARPAAPPAEMVSAAGTQPAAVAPDEICQRDRESLELLRSHPTSDELVRFANKLGCKALLPEVVTLLKGLAPPPTAAEAPNASPPDAQAGNEAARPAPPVAGADVATLTSDEACKRDEDRLERLRSNPSGEEAQRFAGELGCESLRPQLQRLVESLRSVALAPTHPASSSPSSMSLLSRGCASERAALDRLRKEPSAEAAGAFWHDLRCEGLRPQVRLLMESLNVAPEPVGSAAARSDAGEMRAQRPTRRSQMGRVRAVTNAAVTLALSDVSSAAACRHFSIWNFPWPQPCPPKQIGQFMREASPPTPSPASPPIQDEESQRQQTIEKLKKQLNSQKQQ